MPKSRRKKTKKLNPRVLLVGLLALIAVSYYTYSRLPRTRTAPVSINEVSNAVPATISLSLTADSGPFAVGSEIPVSLQIDTGGSLVTAIAVELTYDTSLFQTPTVAVGDFLTVSLQKPRVANGTLSFVLAAPPESGGQSGSGTLADIQLKAIQNGTSNLTFTERSMAAAIGFETNMLRSAQDLTIRVGNSDSASSDSPTVRQDNSQTNRPPALNSSPTGYDRPTKLAPVEFGSRPGVANSKAQLAGLNSANRSTAFSRFLAWINRLFEN